MGVTTFGSFHPIAPLPMNPTACADPELRFAPLTIVAMVSGVQPDFPETQSIACGSNKWKSETGAES